MNETQDPRFLGHCQVIGDAVNVYVNWHLLPLAKSERNKTSLLNGPKLRLFATEVNAAWKPNAKLRVSVCSEDGKTGATHCWCSIRSEENKRLGKVFSSGTGSN